MAAELAHALRTATAPDDALAHALATLAAQAFEGADAKAERMRATLALHGLSACWHWRHADGPRDEKDAAVLALRSLEQQLDHGAPDAAWVQNALAAGLSVCSLDSKPQATLRASLALTMLGMALDRDVAALPALGPLYDLIAEALAIAIGNDEPAVEAPIPDTEGADAPPPGSTEHDSFASRCQAVLVAFSQRVDAEGFSQYLMEQAVADLRELQVADEAEAALLNQALVSLVDLALPHAPPDGKASLQAAREVLLRTANAPAATLGASQAQVACEAIVAQLERALAAGENASGAISRAIFALQLLGQRVASDDIDAGKVVLAAMPRVMSAAAGAAPPEMRAVVEQTSAHFDDAIAAAPRMLASEGDEQAIEAQAARDTLARMAATTADNVDNVDNVESSPTDPLLRHIAAVLRSWLPRVVASQGQAEGPLDGAEGQRLARRIEAALRPAGAASTEAQFIEQMRHALRPLALALRRFERRRHLTLITPPWPVQPVVDEPNAVFTSAGAAVQALLDEAFARLAMTPPAATALDDPAHARWLQLRAAAVAVFDFTAYDRARADPPGPLPQEASAQAGVLRAAAPVAAVAFEAGWALLLGVPMVIVAHEGQAVPFDIDVAPVRLRGDGTDSLRLALALVTAQFGTQRGSSGDGLGHTLAAMRSLAAGHAPALSLLDAVTDTGDALRVQFAARAALERLGTASALLVCPAFAAHPAVERRSVFHVSGFRDWSLPVQQAVRDACGRAGMDYRIGHDDLDPVILRAVWAGLAQAACVVADLTTLNPNAVLELAMAQAMGRPTLILSRHADTAQALPALQKLRIHHYEVDTAGLLALGRLLDRFLG